MHMADGDQADRIGFGSFIAVGLEEGRRCCCNRAEKKVVSPREVCLTVDWVCPERAETAARLTRIRFRARGRRGN